MILEILTDALLDTLKLIPLLFLTYLLMEYLERRFEGQAEKLIVDNRFGIPLAALIGAIPQCGFSASASELYCCGIISYAALITVYFSTSDEMLPLLLSHAADPLKIAKIVGIKVLIAVIAGIVTSLLFRKKRRATISDACENENCSCEEHGIFVSALLHTGNVALFIGLVTLILNGAVALLGEDTIQSFLSLNPVLTLLCVPLVGLIPNCAASVIITEMYLGGMIPASLLIAGLCANSGVALLVLFKNDPDRKESFFTVVYLYGLSVLTGIILSLTGLRI